MTPQDFIRKRPRLVWSTKSYDKLSDEVIVEGVLNYGDFDDVKKLISILGMKETAEIFQKQTRKKRHNYRPDIKHYFQLYFKHHAKGHRT